MATVEPEPLTSIYTFPVSQPKQIRAVCNLMPLSPKDKILHEDLSSVQGGPRFTQLEQRIRMAERGQFARELVTGHSGSGKSTELLLLAARLRALQGTQGFHVVYLDVQEYLSPWGIRLPHVILALLAALAQEERIDLRTTRPGEKLFTRIKNLASGFAKEAAKDIDGLIKLPLLTAALKANQTLSAEFRDRAFPQIQEWLRELNDLVAEVSQALNTEVVFIVDNLEKIPEQETEGGASLHDRLFVRDLPLLDIPAHLVLTHPISLNYSNPEFRRAYPNARMTTLPMVGVRLPPESSARGEDPAGMQALKQLLLRRVSSKVFVDDAAIDHVVRLSGGCVRDLMRFMAELPIVANLPFTRADVDKAVQDFKNDYERLLSGKPYVRHLPAIEDSGRVPDDMAEDWKREILLGLVILEYDTNTWFGAHPLVKLTRAFTAARNG